MSKLLQVFYPVSYSRCILLQSLCDRKKQRNLSENVGYLWSKTSYSALEQGKMGLLSLWMLGFEFYHLIQIIF